MHWDDTEQAMLDAVYIAFSEPVSVNSVEVDAIVKQETVEIGDYASVVQELRWRIYAKKSGVGKFNRMDLVSVGAKQFRVEAPDTDDGSEVTAWLREIAGDV